MSMMDPAIFDPATLGALRYRIRSTISGTRSRKLYEKFLGPFALNRRWVRVTPDTRFSPLESFFTFLCHCHWQLVQFSSAELFHRRSKQIWPSCNFRELFALLKIKGNIHQSVSMCGHWSHPYFVFLDGELWPRVHFIRSPLLLDFWVVIFDESGRISTVRRTRFRVNHTLISYNLDASIVKLRQFSPP